VSDSRIASHRLHIGQKPFHGIHQHCTLNATVLITKGDLKMQDLLAMALKAEMTGFNHARMHWPDGDLVNLLALHSIKIHDPYAGLILRGLVPNIDIRLARLDKADRFEPGVAFGNEAPLLGDFALKKVHLRTIAGHRGKLAAVDQRTSNVEQTLTVAGENAKQPHLIGY
jgi:hypothetical protein